VLPTRVEQIPRPHREDIDGSCGFPPIKSNLICRQRNGPHASIVPIVDRLRSPAEPLTLVAPGRSMKLSYSGWLSKNFHISWSAEMENVVFPTTDAIATMASLPAQMWPSPFSRYNSTVALPGHR
jgi:hypothetical protein